MSDYVRQKVLRLPVECFQFEEFKKHIAKKLEEMGQSPDDINDDIWFYTEKAFPEVWDYGHPGRFQYSPTCRAFVDFVLEHQYGSDGDWGKIRELYPIEKAKYLPIFQKVLPGLENLDDVRLVEFCWYNGCDAPDYYDLNDDVFYKEV